MSKFVLSEDYFLSDTIILGASTKKQLEENLQSMATGPLDDGFS